MALPILALIVHAAATWGMTGLIWFIQLVHYPAYRDVGVPDFTAFQKHSPARTGFVVGPLIAAEAGTGAWLLWHPPAGIAPAQLWLGALLIGVYLVSTVVVQIPLHLRLTERRDPVLIDRLLRTNWVRTVIWSLRSVLVMSWLGAVVQR